jgi:predicted component of type VI protein secretion system
MTLSQKLNPADRDLLYCIVTGLTGTERQRETARIRSKLLRLHDAYRQADNARKAAIGRERYAADIDESRRKSAEKVRRKRARIVSIAQASDSAGSTCLA